MKPEMNPKTRKILKRLKKKVDWCRKVANEEIDVPFTDDGKVDVPTSMDQLREMINEKLGFERLTKAAVYHKTNGVDTPVFKELRDELNGEGLFEGDGIFEKLKGIKDKTGNRKKEFERIKKRAQKAQKKIDSLTSQLVNLRAEYNQIRKELLIAKQLNAGLTNPNNKNIFPIGKEKM